jgi:hypothetical protein
LPQPTGDRPRQALGYPVFALEYEYEHDRAALASEGTGVHGLHSVCRNGEYHILMEDTFWRLWRRIPGITARAPDGP